MNYVIYCNLYHGSCLSEKVINQCNLDDPDGTRLPCSCCQYNRDLAKDHEVESQSDSEAVEKAGGLE